MVSQCEKNVNAWEEAIYSPSLESDEGNINVADVASLKVQNKTADIKCLSPLKRNFNGIQLTANLREGNSQWKTTIDSVSITVVNKEGKPAK